MREFETVEELHAKLLDMAKVFHDICQKHQIPYYMLGGTMLGAIRHKGFIPWDDDMDFGIPREHFENFQKACLDELPLCYKLHTVETSEYAALGINKLSDQSTKVVETYSVKSSEYIGINIDIFPLDQTNNNTSFCSFNMYIRGLFKLQKLLFIESKNRPCLKKILANVIQSVFQISRKFIPSYITNIMKGRLSQKKKDYIINYFGAWGMKELLPKDVFGVPRLYKFDSIELYGVEKYDDYLKSLYGDYMQLPSEENRHLHFDNIFYL